MASKDRNSSNALEVECELTNRAHLEPPPPHLPWYPSAPIPHQAPHVIHQAIPSHPQMYSHHPHPQDLPPRYINRYMPVESKQAEDSERQRLKRVIEETLNEDSERNLKLKRLKADKKELLHLKSIMNQ